MKLGKVSPLKRAFLHTLFLSLSFMVTWQVTAHAATTVTFGDNTDNDFPGTVEDAVIYERTGFTTTNYGGLRGFSAGDPASSARTRRALIRFKNIAYYPPARAEITSATMHLISSIWSV